MFSWLKSRRRNPIDEYVCDLDNRAALYKKEMESAEALDVEPSDECGVVIYDRPDLQTYVVMKTGSIITKIETGTVQYTGNSKICKNSRGETTRVEILKHPRRVIVWNCFKKNKSGE